jgi:hypothetical protein
MGLAAPAVMPSWLSRPALAPHAGRARRRICVALPRASCPAVASGGLSWSIARLRLRLRAPAVSSRPALRLRGPRAAARGSADRLVRDDFRSRSKEKGAFGNDAELGGSYHSQMHVTLMV